MRLAIMDLIGKLLRVQFKVEGFPYGASYKRAVIGCSGLRGSKLEAGVVGNRPNNVGMRPTNSGSVLGAVRQPKA